ncbi:ATP-dependent DNA/RNA helicase DHX36 [Colias croceus]|uniref:ATP-dependent DNA/RNA helicase DHX36 n=1 Tax=Colias crocea TaxID=72248 RepID=UPI001E280228|nr:ATP-dependent DNA/RNA helicase DHX36 [Colias croceus]XP_045500589.1 ATP-dependent DNA/RNA helicase DHX36 [Colias croceus]
MSKSRGNDNWKRTHNPRGRGWSGDRQSGHRRPPGLRGKEIGMYYRNLYKTQKKKDPKVMNLKIPATILTEVDNNLTIIEEIASKENISIASMNDILFQNFKIPKSEKIKRNESDSNMDSENDDESACKDQKRNDSAENLNISFKNYQSAAKDKIVNNEELMEVDHGNKITDKSDKEISDNARSCITDSLPTKKESSKEKPASKPTNEKVFALRQEKHFKYGYEDIITGTFQEKLDENLSNGIPILSSDAETNNHNELLHKEYNNMLTISAYKKMLEFRKILPAYKKRDHILDVIDKNQVIVISGETGCGKSTQIPQLILDQAIISKKGANTKILVTQPRRIAASSLAMRVANERAEKLGTSVGYSVRLEKVEPRTRGSIMYCTTGVLLVELEVNQALTNFSHIILDEVHERDSHIDLAMCMLKQILKKRNDLRLILMSATLDADVLSNYFDDCPVVHIEGLAYPVEDVYLEDILKFTNFKLEEEPPKPKKPIWMKHRDKGKAHVDPDEMEKDIQYKAEIAPWLESVKKDLTPHVYKTLQDSRIEKLNINLILELLIYICKGDPGAILVFLPGMGEIGKLIRSMETSNQFPSSRYEIYPLHSKLATLEQHKIFDRPPDGIRKIIIATNIAETSITIDDIVYVIDCGRLKISGLNVVKNISTLDIQWVAKANLRQRRGRAGRCQPGICYHLLTSYRANQLPDRLLPELQRSNLLEPVLMVKKLRLGMAVEAFQMVPSQPAKSTVEWAVRHLQKCGALDDKEILTPLGWHLARLPIHPAAGKLLLLGALFGCLDRAASVAAVWSFKDPFQLVLGKEFETKQIKRSLALGEPSDHVAISEAIMQWEMQPNREKRSFAYENYLSSNTLELLRDMKRQLGDNLKQMGFLANGDIQSEWENRNWNNISLFKAIVAAALYPNLAQVHWRNLRSYKRPATITAYCPEDGKVKVHPSSVMTQQTSRKHVPTREQLCNNPGANWLVYWLKQKSSDLFLIEVTLVYTLPLLFFGEFFVQDDPDDSNNCFMTMSSINVRCDKNTTNRILKLRYLLDKVLANKVMTTSTRHSVKHSEFEEQVLNAVIQLITAEDEQAEYYDDGSFSDTSDKDNAY